MFFEKVNLLYQELCDCGSSDACYIYSMFNRGKEMVKDVITVIHDCLIKKDPRHFYHRFHRTRAGLVEDSPV